MTKSRKKVNPDAYYKIYNWMPVGLGLSGSKLLVYAYLYAYSTSENGKGCYFGGHEAISKNTGFSTRQITRTIQALMNEGLIERKTVVFDNGLERNYYRITTAPLEENVLEFSEDVKSDLTIIRSFNDNWDNLTTKVKRVF